MVHGFFRLRLLFRVVSRHTMHDVRHAMRA